MKKLLLFVAAFIGYSVYGQFNYSFTNAFSTQGTYVDIAATGTVIPVSAVDSSSTAPQNIGFDFLFNGTVFTQFMLNADGIVRLGTIAPGAASNLQASNRSTYHQVFANATAPFSGNLLMPFFTDLVPATSSTPQFHVLTSGTAPSRVCTIQFKNLKDVNIAPSQFNSLEFQVKLYETTNDIEFIYGNFQPSAEIAGGRFACVGIKANTANFITTNKRALHNWPVSDFLNAVFVESPGLAFYKNTIPIAGTGFKFYGTRSNDISVAQLFTDNTISKQSAITNQIEAIIKNEGTTAISNIPVKITVTGANSFTETINIASLQPGASQTATFTSFSVNNEGEQTVEITTAATGDLNAGNNSRSAKQNVTANTFRVADTALLSGFGFGFNELVNTSMQAQRVYATGTHIINQLAFKTSAYLSKARIRLYEDNGANGLPGTLKFTSGEITTEADNTKIVSLDEPVTMEGNFFIVMEQLISKNIGLHTTVRFPRQANRQYTGNGTTWSEVTNHSGIYYLEATEQVAGIDLAITKFNDPGCNYSANETVSISLKNYSANTHNFSSNPVTINAFARDPQNNIINFPVQVKNSGTLAANASETIVLSTNYNTLPRGYHFFSAKITCVGDAAIGNDSLGFYINNGTGLSKSITDSLCPSSSVVLTAPTNYLAAPYKWTLNNEFFSNSTSITVAPIATTAYYFEATDYRGCLLKDSVIVPVKTAGVTAKPVISFTGNTLRGNNHFRDTLSVPKLDGHTYLWFESGSSTTKSDTSFVIGPVASTLAQYTVQIKRTADGCTNMSDPISIEYAPGVLLNTTDPISVCDTSFYDLGGPIGLTGNSTTRTFSPATPGAKMKLSIYNLNLAQFASLGIYDGTSSNSPRIEVLEPTDNGNSIQEFVASNPDGVITVVFSRGSSNSSGWLAGLSCHNPSVFRSISDGLYTDKTIWESKSKNGVFQPAIAAPFKGDDSVYVKHNIDVLTAIQADQVVIEPAGHLTIKEDGNIRTSVVEGQTSFNVKGILENERQIFGGGIMHVSGTIRNIGSLNLDTIYINGNTPQILTGTEDGAIDNLVMNNSAGLTIDGSQQITRLLSLQKGLINTSANNYLILSGRPVIEGGSNQSHVNGPLRVESNSTYNFPIGKNGMYRPVELNAGSSTSEGGALFEAEIIMGAPTARTLPATITNVSDVRYYRITPVRNGIQSNFTVTLPYDTDEVIGSPEALRIAKDDGANAWIDLGGAATGETPGTITSIEFENFSDFVLAATTDGVLPLTLVNFNGSENAGAVLLNWSAIREKDLRYFDIERSIDGRTYQSITTVAGNESINSTSFYNYKDASLPAGAKVLFYRLKMIDKNGKVQYSSILFIKLNELIKAGIVKVYPNPFNNKILITYNADAEETLKVEILDITGKRIMQSTPVVQKGVNQLQMILPNMVQGIYMLRITNKEEAVFRKLIKE